jgi:hypothetical protein
MKQLYLIILLATGSASYAQQLAWATNISQQLNSKGLFCDREGALFHYGSSLTYQDFTPFSYSPADPEGSFLCSYTPEGKLIFERSWNQPFWIMDIVYDGSGSMYATGNFSGTQTIDGQTIVSRGQADGFVARLDMKGHLQWIGTFGGSQIDCSNSVTLSADKKTVLCTGSVRDTLWMNGIVVAPAAQRSMIVAAFSADGTPSGHRLFDFLSTKDIGNCGYEINTAPDGGYYLLHNREGRSWEGDNTSAPSDGTYLAKLDGNLEPAWSRFVINGSCYYGYQSRGMSHNTSGEIFLPSFCRSKVGGTGLLNRLDGVAGSPTWSVTNKDGSYTDTHCEGDNLYVVGTEGAYACPCEENDPGHQVVRKYDGHNSVLAEMQFRDVRLEKVTSDGKGHIYVQGFFTAGQVTLGPYTIINNTQGEQHFIIRLDEEKDQSGLTGEEAIKDQVADVRIFPNPSRDVFRLLLSSQGPLGIVTLNVRNLTGEVIFSSAAEVQSVHFETTFDLGRFGSGLYFVEVVYCGRRENLAVIVD